ncbi:MAG: TPM domain-containing protein [Pseudomonadota bacterium]
MHTDRDGENSMVTWVFMGPRLRGGDNEFLDPDRAKSAPATGPCIWRAFALALLLVAMATASAGAAEPNWPALTGRVVDEAGLLSAQQRADLDSMLAQHEAATGDQIVVVTVNSLQGLSIEEYGVGLGRYWGIGQAGKNNGALLIVAPNEREVRIEVGYGLEGTLTDALASTIVQNEILPAFRAGRMGEGIVAGTTAILAALGGKYQPSEWAAAGGQSAGQGNVDFPDWGVPIVFFMLWLTIALLISRYKRRHGVPTRSLWLGGTGSSRSWGSGGFSGGGGSFGGGGSSGRW